MRGRHAAPAIAEPLRQAEDPAFALPSNNEVVFVPVNLTRLIQVCRSFDDVGC